MAERLTSWSFSRWVTYDQCPYLAKIKFIDKMQEPSAPAMARGDAVHKAAEAYIKGVRDDLAPELDAFRDELAGLRKRRAETPQSIMVEETWAFRADWSLTRWNDWNGCWLRIKVDCAEVRDDGTLLIEDWKTGKFREEMQQQYLMQLDLYALGALKAFPAILAVNPMLIYTDQDVVHHTRKPYARSDEERLQKSWERRVAPMMADETFRPTPSDKCRWCHFRAAKGGPCTY